MHSSFAGRKKAFSVAGLCSPGKVFLGSVRTRLLEYIKQYVIIVDGGIWTIDLELRHRGHGTLLWLRALADIPVER
jgi:hypothetical protein